MPKVMNSESRIKVHDMPQESLRSGGESRPFDFPHLYRIRAGDWRISYAVEHNRLAVLVLEVLHPGKDMEHDPAREDVAGRMKVKLLGLPEGENQQAAFEAAGHRPKIKFLDAPSTEAASEGVARRVRFKPSTEAQNDFEEDNPPEEGEQASRITFLDLASADEETSFDDEVSDAGEAVIEGKVTPLDLPSE